MASQTSGTQESIQTGGLRHSRVDSYRRTVSPTRESRVHRHSCSSVWMDSREASTSQARAFQQRRTAHRERYEDESEGERLFNQFEALGDSLVKSSPAQPVSHHHHHCADR
ncbi:hypothetical protein PIB30_038242 [Stylosanthes scabra]|uniref:Uncharacterized protein n=1 Tax=Stylosanthes scabra TaxID=79078 RepID=A0ABU6VEL6_9FABA|nr:hypothetical protein [Stylosanthes scabra]